MCRILFTNIIVSDDIGQVISNLDALQACLLSGLVYHELDNVAILLEAGMQPDLRNNQALLPASLDNNVAACRLLVEHEADPFAVQDGEDDANRHHATVLNSANSHPIHLRHALVKHSPFQTAVHHKCTELLDYFLELWNERHPNASILEFFCRDPHLSFEEIQFLVERHPDRAAEKE
jgi:hypothetical protein